jgi:hypothetical protein
MIPLGWVLVNLMKEHGGTANVVLLSDPITAIATRRVDVHHQEWFKHSLESISDGNVTNSIDDRRFATDRDSPILKHESREPRWP